MNQLLKQRDHIYHPLFRDYNDLVQWKAEYVALNDKNAKRRTDVADSPDEHNWATQVAIVGKIFAAIADFAEAKDKVNSAA
jgi:hypothetical protein